MAKEFVFKDFLRHTDPPLLEEYCKKENIDYKSKSGEKIEEAVKRFVGVWEGLENKKRYKVELDFRTINDLTPQSGFLNLIAEAKQQSEKLPEQKLEEMGSHNASLWFFLNKPKIFDEASVRYEVEDTLGWKEIEAQKKGADEVVNKETELANAVKDFLHGAEFRAGRCTAEYYKVNDLVCYVVYPEDWADFDISYDTRDKLNKRSPRKPVFKIYFLYDPATGRLSTKAKGGWKKTKEFQKIFASAILGQQLDTSKDRVFDLNRLKDLNFGFPTPPEDGVKFVRVKLLRFSYPDASGRRITLDLKGGERNGLEDMCEFINNLQIPLGQLNISQVSIQVKFPQPSKGMKGEVTAHLTHPNSWDLGNKVLHRKVKTYLKNWGIDKGFSNATDTQ